jgi:hypothetical protein
MLKAWQEVSFGSWRRLDNMWSRWWWHFRQYCSICSIESIKRKKYSELCYSCLCLFILYLFIIIMFSKFLMHLRQLNSELNVWPLRILNVNKNETDELEHNTRKENVCIFSLYIEKDNSLAGKAVQIWKQRSTRKGGNEWMQRPTQPSIIRPPAESQAGYQIQIGEDTRANRRRGLKRLTSWQLDMMPLLIALGKRLDWLDWRKFKCSILGMPPRISLKAQYLWNQIKVQINLFLTCSWVF